MNVHCESLSPDVLLRSDIATAAPEDRAAVVDAIVRAWNEGALTSENELYGRYHKLAHPNLAGQLRPWILDRALSAIARNSAIEIAQVCELKEIGSDLASLALDPTEHYRIRTAAARCIAETADGAIKLALNRLLSLRRATSSFTVQERYHREKRSSSPTYSCGTLQFYNFSHAHPIAHSQSRPRSLAMEFRASKIR